MLFGLVWALGKCLSPQSSLRQQMFCNTQLREGPPSSCEVHLAARERRRFPAASPGRASFGSSAAPVSSPLQTVRALAF